MPKRKRRKSFASQQKKSNNTNTKHDLVVHNETVPDNSVDNDFSFKRTANQIIRWTFVIIAFLGLLLLPQMLYVMRILADDYRYLGYNPLYVGFRFPEVNLIVSGIVFTILTALATILFLIYRNSRYPKYMKVVLLLVLTINVSAMIGCMHSFVYYVDPKAYVMDERVIAIQGQRNSEALRSAVSLTELKLASLEKFIDTIYSIQDKSFPTKKHFGRTNLTRTVFTDNYRVKYEVETGIAQTQIEIKEYLLSCLGLSLERAAW